MMIAPPPALMRVNWVIRALFAPAAVRPPSECIQILIWSSCLRGRPINVPIFSQNHSWILIPKHKNLNFVLLHFLFAKNILWKELKTLRSICLIDGGLFFDNHNAISNYILWFMFWLLQWNIMREFRSWKSTRWIFSYYMARNDCSYIFVWRLSHTLEENFCLSVSLQHFSRVLMLFAKLSLSFSFSLTELVIVSANPATRHHPDKYKYIFLELKHERQSSFYCSYEL